ncbi:DNA methyltransferase [Flavobacterium sp. ZB4R12]|uniref:DNA methyltransferase n=1 Tax=Flavobacterium sp. ZB4R12 TaxID=3398732 RepID=UPI003AB0CC5E
MKLYAILESVLKSESNNITTTKLLDNQGDLMLNKIHDLVDKTDENLIGLLLENQELREKFFFKIKDVYVFKTNDFKFFLDENKIDNSYTQYENRIGLTAGGKFLKDCADVVLDFPYKDCILEGGQRTEEGTDTYFEYEPKDGHYLEKQAKRKEIFFNTVLAKDEIDRLLEPKAFTNIKKYTANGEENITSFNRDENGTIKDNLIIKGNNLLALHTLKSEFAGKVKLIYIDPPYNTEKDTFKYNDNFTHSTWLTFIYNRISIAKVLLKDDGLIFISCDDNEQSYLKVICDEIFRRENFIANLPTVMNLKGNNDEFGFAGTHEYTLVYGINKKIAKINEFDIEETELEKWDTDDIGYFKKGAPLRATGDEDKREDRTDMFYPILVKEDIASTITAEEHSGIYNKVTKEFEDDFLNSLISKYKDLGYDVILPLSDNDYGRWRWGFSEKNRKRLSYDVIVSNTKNGISLYKKQRPDLNDLPSKKPKSLFYKPEYSSGNGTAQIKKIFGTKIFKNPKPVDLIKDFVKIGSDDNDIILDFFSGSGTTGDAIIQLNNETDSNRGFILVEQLDYVEQVTCKRVSNSIFEEKKGSFVYLELAKNNQNAIEHIQSCENYQDLVDYFDEMSNKYFLHYNVKLKEFREVICKEENFKKLTLDQQKIMFVKMLDLNQLYVNVSDMEDSRYALSSTDIAVTKDFYQI